MQSQGKVRFSSNEGVETVSLSDHEREQIQEFAKRRCSMSNIDSCSCIERYIPRGNLGK